MKHDERWLISDIPEDPGFNFGWSIQFPSSNMPYSKYP